MSEHVIIPIPDCYEGENIIHGFNLIDRGRSDGARLYVLLSANRGNGMGP